MRRKIVVLKSLLQISAFIRLDFFMLTWNLIDKAVTIPVTELAFQWNNCHWYLNEKRKPSLAYIVYSYIRKKNLIERMYVHVQILSFWSRARKSIIFIYWSFQYCHFNIYCIVCLCDFLDELNSKKKLKYVSMLNTYCIGHGFSRKTYKKAHISCAIQRSISQTSIWNVSLISFKYLRLRLKAS